MDDFLDYYKSLTPDHIEFESLLVEKSMAEGVIPDSIRYGMIKDAYRGVMKSTHGEYYYFHFGSDGELRLSKAEKTEDLIEINRVAKTTTFGCDLRKAEGGGTGGASLGGSSGGGSDSGSNGGGVGQPIIQEEDDIAAQHDLTTDKHPGGAVGMTPDRPEVGRQWHQPQSKPMPMMGKSLEATEYLNSMVGNLEKSIESLGREPSDKEKQFMVEILGKTPEQVKRGDTYMNPTQKVIFQQWLNKSMTKRVSSLSNWLKKND